MDDPPVNARLKSSEHDKGMAGSFEATFAVHDRTTADLLRGVAIDTA